MSKVIEAVICTHCKEELPLNAKNFYRNKSSRHGFNLHCKECQKAKMRAAYGPKAGDFAVKKSTFDQAKKGKPKALAELKRLNVTAIWNGREMVRL